MVLFVLAKLYCRDDFNNRFNSKEYDTDNYEIMMVTWGEHCVFSALVHETLYFEELIGFFG